MTYRSFFALLFTLLTACGSNQTDETKAWMEQTKQTVRSGVPPIPEPKKFDPFVYSLQSEVDPFNSLKLTRVLDAKGSKRNAPNTDRRREPLEAFPLDQLKMVGTIRNGKLTYALIEADKSLYQIKVGNYIGQNFGMVVGITDFDVKIRETVADQMGEWMERENSLVLQEATKEATK